MADFLELGNHDDGNDIFESLLHSHTLGETTVNEAVEDFRTQRRVLFEKCEAMALDLLLSSSSPSSSSSSSEGDDVSDFATALRLQSKKNKKFKFKGFVEMTLSDDYESKFRGDYRMKKDVASWLINKVKECRPANRQGGRKRISAEKEVLAYIWYATNSSSMREIAEKFDMGMDTLCRVVHRMSTFLVTTVGQDLIRFPHAPDEKQTAVREFRELAGVPDVLGALDATYIKCVKPKGEERSAYVNRHPISLTLQGICNARKMFIDVYTGHSAKAHDATVYQYSPVSRWLEESCGPHHVIADTAYPLRSYLLTPFTNYLHMTPEEAVFNERFMATRVVIQSAFVQLKNRFRRLRHLEMHHVKDMSEFILACCVLHNLSVMAGDVADFAEDADDGSDDSNRHTEPVIDHDEEGRRLGVMKRYHIMKTMLY